MFLGRSFKLLLSGQAAKVKNSFGMSLLAPTNSFVLLRNAFSAVVVNFLNLTVAVAWGVERLLHKKQDSALVDQSPSGAWYCLFVCLPCISGSLLPEIRCLRSSDRCLIAKEMTSM